ncbi:hypothetical protein R1sor_002309 [Riccia sorocarpa]|uniref:Uncharacterized protein n=1 Tax=Riccia sorocarpa TaxID=122646 RepID=A0ABD3GYF3_9MARC
MLGRALVMRGVILLQESAGAGGLTLGARYGGSGVVDGLSTVYGREHASAKAYGRNGVGTDGTHLDGVKLAGL